MNLTVLAAAAGLVPAAVPPADTLDRDVDCVASLMLTPPGQSVDEKVATQLAYSYYFGRVDARTADLARVAEAISRLASDAGETDAQTMRNECLEGLREGSARLRKAISEWTPSAK